MFLIVRISEPQHGLGIEWIKVYQSQELKVDV